MGFHVSRRRSGERFSAIGVVDNEDAHGHVFVWIQTESVPQFRNPRYSPPPTDYLRQRVSTCTTPELIPHQAMEWKWVTAAQLFSPSPSREDDEIQRAAPGSMPVEWSKCSGLLEWKKPWYSHGLETQGDSRSDPSIFCSASAPRKAPASCESGHDGGECCDPAIRCNGTRCGQAWTVALCALWGCRDAHGLEASLDFLGKVVLGLAPSELGQACGDFEKAIETKKQELGMKVFFNPSVERLLVSVAANFKQEMTACLPLHVLQFALEFVNLSENGELCTVSKEFREAAEGDALWREAYQKRFPKTDGEVSNALQGGPDSGDGGSGCAVGDVASTASPLVSHKEPPADREHGHGCFKHLYKERIQDPHVGDQVEVAWKGKFRLESFEVYDGTAWWVAKVVDKGERPGCYQVHYPGWEDKWDEWVPRDRLRWGNERLAAALAGIAPKKGDSVEMWCQGLHVPGAWLEAVVHRVEKGRLYLGEVLTSGHFWVDAEHVRLIKQSRVDEDGEEDQQEAYGDISAYRTSSILLQALSDAGFTGSASSPGCCSLM